MYTSYKTLPELTNYSDADKKALYIKVCLTFKSRILNGIFVGSLILIITSLISLQTHRCNGKPQLDLSIHLLNVLPVLSGIIGLAWVFLIIKLNTYDRILLQDYKNGLTSR